MCPPCLSFFIQILSLRHLVTFYQFRLVVTGACTRQTRVFPTPFTQGGGGQVKGDKALMEGLMRVDIDLMGGPNFDRLYHKLKLLLLLNCNYTMQFIGYDCTKTR